jgi:hypothetical protein
VSTINPAVAAHPVSARAGGAATKADPHGR